LKISWKSWVFAVFMLALAGVFGYVIGMVLRRGI
jgi:hypothetical protein